MDGDDYEFMEKTLEIPESVNGSDQMDEPEDKNRSQRLKHKSDENDYNIDHRVKRSRAGDQSWDSEKERSSTSHYHSFLRDRERTERDRYRSSRELKERDKDRNWTEDNRKERIRDKIKKMDRDRERRKHGHEDEPERDREQEQEKSKGRSHSGRHSGDWVRERSRDRERNPDMEYEDRERQSEIWQRDRESRRSMEKKEEVAEPEADLLRDQRTIFAYQISKRADERDVYEFFTRAGKVRDVRLIMDRNSRRSKGVGYIEFYDVKSVPLAIALSGQPLLGQPVMVKLSEAEKDLAQSTARVATGATGFIGPYSGGVRKLYVGNLHFNINEDQLRQVFEPFGAVELVKLPFDPETGHSKGYGFVQFAHIEDARAALNLDGQLDIAGRVIKVSAAIKQTGGREIGANAGDFDDDDEGGGPSLGAQSRKLLMQKLDCTGRTSSVAGSLGSQVMNPDLSAPAAPIVRVAPGVSPLLVPFGQIPVPALEGWPTAGLSLPALTVPSIDSIGVPSECLLLKNMFDPKLESLTDFDQDIKDDIEDECSRFGKLKHIYADKKSAGFVYLQFENSESAIAAKRALHGRWFAGKMITATFMVPQDYEVKFLQSK